MDTITLSDITLSTLIGIHAWEQRVPQKLRLDITFQTDAAKIGASDTIEKAIDYERVVQVITEFTKSHHCQLIETFADKLAHHLLAIFPTTMVALSLHKPGALKEAKNVSIHLTRSR